MVKRKFYIIGHNPNTVADAIHCTQLGANAIEPDVHYDEVTKSFYVSHGEADPKKVSSLLNYLNELGEYIDKGTIGNLALIAFDLKPPYNYPINALYDVIREQFSNAFGNIAIVTTVSDAKDIPFLKGMVGQRPFEAVGVDEKASPQTVYEQLHDTGLNYTYGAGLTSLLPQGLHDVFGDWVKKAIPYRGIAGGIKMAYGWVINNEGFMKGYLDMGADGFITDDPGKAFKLVTSSEYKDAFDLAQRGHNPFNDGVPPVHEAA